MKYLFTVLAIVVTITIPTAYIVWPESPSPPSNVAVTVNDHLLTWEEIGA